MFDTISSRGRIRRLISTRGRSITNDTKISMARAIVGNRATSGSDQRPMYDQLLRPTTDSTINRGGRRPMVGSIVASCDRSYEHSWHPVAECRPTISCGTRRLIVDQSLGATIKRTINHSIVRPIVATYDRSYDQSWHQTTDRTINRSIVRPIVRSIVRLPIRDHPQLVVSPCTTGGTIT